MANKAYKFRIYPNREQKTLFAKTFGCVRFIYNKMLDDKIKYYEKTKKKRNNTPAQYKKEFPWLKEVDSLALANAQMNLQKAYNNFFRDPKVGFPKFKSRHKTRASYTTNNQKGTVALENGHLKLPKAGYVKVKQHRADTGRLPDQIGHHQSKSGRGLLCKRSVRVRKPSTKTAHASISWFGFFHAGTVQGQ